MTAYTASVTGAWNSASTWGGGGVPGNGDTATINSGVTVTVTADQIVGVTTGTLNGVRILGTSSAVYGKLAVNDGVKLTMKGPTYSGGTRYHALKIDQYAHFEPAPGSTVMVDCEGDCTSGILNQGIYNSVGVAGNHVHYSVPPGRYSWGAYQPPASFPVQNLWFPWDTERNIACIDLGRTFGYDRISNAAHTGVGSMNSGGGTVDTSVIFTNQTPVGIIDQAGNKGVPSVDDIHNPGEFFIDHACGFVYFYYAYPQSGTTPLPAFTAEYYYLDVATANWHGWFIDMGASGTDIPFNEGRFEYSDFEYMGGMANAFPVIRVGNKGAGLGENREFYVKNSSFDWCAGLITFNGGRCAGTEANPILIDRNTMRGTGYSGTDGGGLGICFNKSTLLNHEWITVSNNTANSRWFIDNGAYGGTAFHRHIDVVDNAQTSSVSFYRDFHPPGDSYPLSTWARNNVRGVGLASIVSRAFLDIRGGPEGDLQVYDNEIRNFNQGLVINRFVNAYRNLLYQCYAYGVVGGSGFMGRACNVTIDNNLFYGVGKRRSTSSPAYDTYGANGAIAMFIPAVGYYQWADNWKITNNTFANIRAGAVTLGSMTSGSARFHTFMTRMQIANNLVYCGGTVGTGAYGFQRFLNNNAYQDIAGGVAQFDNNLVYNPATGTFNAGISHFATFLLNGSHYNLLDSPARNVTGVELWNPSYDSNQSNLTLTYIVNTLDSDVRLQLNSGGESQLVWGSGTLTGVEYQTYSWGLNIAIRLLDSSKSWSLDPRSVDSPIGKWIKITSGVATGQMGVVISLGTANDFTDATRLFVVMYPLWGEAGGGPLPAVGDTYVIYQGDVTLDDGLGQTIEAGIDLRFLPLTSKSDSNISIVISNSTTGNPELANPVGTVPIEFRTAQTGAGVDRGTTVNAPTTDYWGVARLASPDIGFYEYPNIPLPSAPGGFHIIS